MAPALNGPTSAPGFGQGFCAEKSSCISAGGRKEAGRNGSNKSDSLSPTSWPGTHAARLEAEAPPWTGVLFTFFTLLPVVPGPGAEALPTTFLSSQPCPCPGARPRDRVAPWGYWGEPRETPRDLPWLLVHSVCT